RPLASNAPAPRPERRLHVGSDYETGRRLASGSAHPSSLARSALRRQTPKVGAGCSNWARPDLRGGCAVMCIPTAILDPLRSLVPTAGSGCYCPEAAKLPLPRRPAAAQSWPGHWCDGATDATLLEPGCGSACHSEDEDERMTP